MLDFSSWKKGWELLEKRERRNAWVVLGIVTLGALSSALMVGSILPFLSVLADPGAIQSVESLAWAYDRFGFTSDYSFLIALGLASMGVIVLTSLMQILKTWAIFRFSFARMHSLSYRLMVIYMRQPYEFFLNRHSGEMSTRILAETQQVVNLFFKPAVELIATSLTTLAIAGLVLWIEPFVGCLVLAIFGVVYGIIYKLSRSTLNRLGRERVANNSERFRIVNEALNGVKEIKLLGREGSYLAQYQVPSQKMVRKLIAVQFISQLPPLLLQAFAFAGIVLLCLLMLDANELAAGKALGGVLPIIGLFALAGQRLMPELSKLFRALSTIQAGAAAVDAIYDDMIRGSGGIVLPRSLPLSLGLQGSLRIENLSYQYPGAAHAGVWDVSVEIHAGEKIGIVGETGAGKTTLVDLILGLLDPEQGCLVVDGTPVSKSNLRAWQMSVGYVPQNIFLRDASVTENIALGVPVDEIDQMRVQEAALVARLDHFIRDELPDGYSTAIGERGVRLSGGQRQRIGIARALYHDVDLMVFDEATSALDNLTEREVIAAIDALPKEKTVVMVAHRLSTLKRCDKILVMEQGRVVGYDSWEALMANNTIFNRMVRTHEAL